MIQKIYCADALEGLKSIEDQSVSCCVTSPPYYGLRDYGVDGQIGLESSPEEYISKLVNVFHEVKRTLCNEGTLWVNIGDSYAGSGKGAWKNKLKQKETYVPDPNGLETKAPKTFDGIKPKDLIGIPWSLAFALREDGWYLRQDIIWQKTNPMPESVKDRCTKSHEYIFLLSKSPNYYFDAKSISEPVSQSTVLRLKENVEKQQGSSRSYGGTKIMKAVAPRYGGKKYTEHPDSFFRTKSGNAYDFHERRNKRDVWTVSTRPFKQAHFATFPPNLILPCILAGCPKGETVLDPFLGSGTTAIVAKKSGRGFIGIDLNREYCKMAENRLKSTFEQMKINEL